MHDLYAGKCVLRASDHPEQHHATARRTACKNAHDWAQRAAHRRLSTRRCSSFATALAPPGPIRVKARSSVRSERSAPSTLRGSHRAFAFTASSTVVTPAHQHPCTLFEVGELPTHNYSGHQTLTLHPDLLPRCTGAHRSQTDRRERAGALAPAQVCAGARASLA